MKKLEDYIRTVPDFPKKGIMFRDITAVLQDKEGLKLAIDSMEKLIKDMGATVIAGAEARGFLLGMPVAYNLSLPFVPVRKKGKLPAETVSVDYSLEYGVDVLEIHKDAIKKGQKVAIVDDLLATGGTVEAVAKLVEKVGAEVVALDFAIELTELKGRDKLEGYEIMSLVQYDV